MRSNVSVLRYSRPFPLSSASISRSLSAFEDPGTKTAASVPASASYSPEPRGVSGPFGAGARYPVCSPTCSFPGPESAGASAKGFMPQTEGDPSGRYTKLSRVASNVCLFSAGHHPGDGHFDVSSTCGRSGSNPRNTRDRRPHSKLHARAFQAPRAAQVTATETKPGRKS